MENILNALTKVLGNNRGLAEDAILCFDKLINFNELDKSISEEAPEEAEDVCWDEVYYIHNLMYDEGLGYLDQHWSRLEDYCKNMNPMGVPSDIVNGMAKVLLQYYKCKKETLDENIKRKTIRLNESQLRNMITEAILYEKAKSVIEEGMVSPHGIEKIYKSNESDDSFLVKGDDDRYYEVYPSENDSFLVNSDCDEYLEKICKKINQSFINNSISGKALLYNFGGEGEIIVEVTDGISQNKFTPEFAELLKVWMAKKGFKLKEYDKMYNAYHFIYQNYSQTISPERESKLLSNYTDCTDAVFNKINNSMFFGSTADIFRKLSKFAN